MTVAPWELSGQLEDAEGDRHGPLDSATWVRKPVILEDGCIVPVAVGLVPPDRMFGAHASPVRSGGASMLASFLTLSDAPDDAIAAFAGAWGMLELCDHGLPRGHAAECRVPRRGRSFWDMRERPDDWRRLAARMVVVLDAARELAERFHAGQVVRLMNLMGLVGEVDLAPVLIAARPGRAASISLGLGSLSQALVAELLYACAGGGTGVRKCDAPGCGRWEQCKRTTPRRRPFYCSAHGKTFDGRSPAAVKEASRRYRERNKADPDRPRQPRGRAAQAT